MAKYQDTLKSMANNILMKRKSKMSMTDEPTKEDFLPLAEKGEVMADSAEAFGPAMSDARDDLESGEAKKPFVPENVDKGSPEREMMSDMPLSEEIMEILRKHKSRFNSGM